MNAQAYWTAQHMKQAIHDIRFYFSCWWLSQRVDFFVWRSRLDFLTFGSPTVLATIPTEEQGCSWDRHLLASSRSHSR